MLHRPIERTADLVTYHPSGNQLEFPDRDVLRDFRLDVGFQPIGDRLIAGFTQDVFYRGGDLAGGARRLHPDSRPVPLDVGRVLSLVAPEWHTDDRHGGRERLENGPVATMRHHGGSSFEDRPVRRRSHHLHVVRDVQLSSIEDLAERDNPADRKRAECRN